MRFERRGRQVPATQRGPEMPDDRELLAALRKSLPEFRADELLDRWTFKRRSDWRGERRFDRVRIRRAEGDTVDLCLKQSMNAPEAHRPMRGMDREEVAYRFLNRHPGSGAPRFLGRVDPAPGHSVLVLEFVRGRRLKKVRTPRVWKELAGWLGRMQGRFSRVIQDDSHAPDLVRVDARVVERWAERAMRPVLERHPGARGRAEVLLGAFGAVADILAAAPPTLTHGELYCTNVMLRDNAEPGPFCPFDWETASIGCGTLDVAYLGRTEMDVTRESLLAAYAAGWKASGGPSQSMSDLQRQHAAGLAYERLYLLWHAVEHRRAPGHKVDKYLSMLEALMDELPSCSDRGAP